MSLQLERDGASHVRDAINPSDWLPLFQNLPQGQPGLRLHGLPWLQQLLGAGSPAQSTASRALGPNSRPVRALLFDKGVDNNWPLGWHQDRVIAVMDKHDVEGFGPWTRKDGLHHVEPPIALMAAMVTLRIHLDDVGPDNAPLRVATGSHRLGRIVVKDYDRVLQQCGEHICLATAGDIWAYSTPILHASSVALRPSRRRVVQVDYSATDLPLPLEWLGI